MSTRFQDRVLTPEPDTFSGASSPQTSREASAGMQVKGSSIASKIEFVLERFGIEAAERLRSFLKQKNVYPVLEATWYPFEIYDAVLEYIAENHFGGEQGRLLEVGQFSARHALSTTYSIYSRLRDFPTFLGKIATLHDRYYSVGKIRVLKVGEGFAEILLFGAPIYHARDLQVAIGFYVGAAEKLGARAARGRYERRQDRVLMRLDWQASEG